MTNDERKVLLKPVSPIYTYSFHVKNPPLRIREYMSMGWLQLSSFYEMRRGRAQLWDAARAGAAELLLWDAARADAAGTSRPPIAGNGQQYSF